MDINKMVKITWQVSGLIIPEWGISVKNRQTEVPEKIANSLIEQGLAKLSKPSKIKQTGKKPKGVE
jgi:hypothetical protein|tara:strand:- start:281 stop:478 length:198 start_codon:yes stop_codon:yes gene_type:complete